MSRKAALLSLLLVSITTMVVVGCKPMAYYLERVDKAYGKVTEAATGVPLESVEVVLGTYQYTELTNGLGDYELELAEGTWTLHFVKDGYVTVDKVVTVSASNPRVKVDAQLMPIAPPPSASWNVGFWGPPTYAPYTNLIEMNASGDVYMYDNYDGTTLLVSGRWSSSPEGVLVTGFGEPIGVTKVGDNEIVFGSHGSAYRKGSALVTGVFTQAETVLSSGVMTEGTIAHQEMKLYSFTAPSAGNYTVSWEAFSIGVAAYRSDQVSSLFIHEGADPGFETISLSAGQKIFIFLDGATGWGNFSIMVQ